MLNRRLLPIKYAIITMTSIVKYAYLPVVKISNGAETRKPLPIIEARGVTVARQKIDVLMHFVKSTKRAKKVETMTAMLLTIKYDLCFYTISKNVKW